MANSEERRRENLRREDRDRSSDAGQNWDYFTAQRFLPEEQGMVGDWKSPQSWHVPQADERSLGRDPRSFPGPVPDTSGPSHGRSGLGAAGGEVEGSYAGRGPRSFRRNDTRIHEDACDRLTDHPDLDPTEVKVAVKDGEITLEGTVASRADKRLAERLCESIPGVRDVHNRLRIAAADEGRNA